MRPTKFETVRIQFLTDVLICCHPEIFLLWQRDVTTSPLCRPYSWYPQSLHDGIKAISRGFLGCKQVVKAANARNRGRVWMFTLDNRKKKGFIIKLWLEVIIVTSLDAVATVDILTANNNDVNLVETPNVLFARLFNSRLVNLDHHRS